MVDVIIEDEDDEEEDGGGTNGEVELGDSIADNDIEEDDGEDVNDDAGVDDDDIGMMGRRNLRKWWRGLWWCTRGPRDSHNEHKSYSQW